MRTILLLVQKEFLQIFRNRTMLPILFLMPVIQVVILSFAATHDIRNLALAVRDDDRSATSRLLVNKLTASGYFQLTGMPLSDKAAFDMILGDKADLVLTIPPRFEKDLQRRQSIQLQVEVNAINGQKAGLAASYAGQVFQQLGSERQATMGISLAGKQRPTTIETTPRFWYNPELDYKTFMVPGILGVMVSMLVLILSAMNVVREKEIGTIEQINVTPIRKSQFITGKLLPFLFIGLFDMALGLAVGKLLFDIPIVGSLWLVFAFCAVSIFAMLGIGFFISNFADTQQQAMFMAWFFMVIFILMSGLFTPIESMPPWAQAMTIPNPIAHIVKVMRLVLLKGSSFADVQNNFVVMAVLGIMMNGLAMATYRKRVG